MLFSASRRATLKVEQPDLTFGEITKVLGAEWAALDVAAKEEFNAAAAKEKASITAKFGATTAIKKRAAGGASKKSNATKEDGVPPKAPKFTAWVRVMLNSHRAVSLVDVVLTPLSQGLFCAERRPQLKLQRPELSFGELSKVIGEEWKAVDADAKAMLAAKAAARSAEAAAALPAAAASADGANVSTAVAPSASSRKPAPKAKRAKHSDEKAHDTDGSDDDIVYADDDDDDVDDADDADRVDHERCDVHMAEDAARLPAPRQRSRGAADADTSALEDPAAWGCDRSEAVQFLLARTRGGSYVAVREMGGVPTLEMPVALRSTAAAALPQAEANVDQLHVEEQEHEYEIAAAQFKAALAERSQGDSIDLDDLSADSPLSSMVILEMLRSPGGPLHDQALGRSKRNLLGVQDVVVKVPAVALSFVVQRLVTAAVAADRASRAAGGASAHVQVNTTDMVDAAALECDAAVPGLA